MIPFFYVHRPGTGWHITLGGDWNTRAVCGAVPAQPVGYWSIRRRFNEQRDPRLEVDNVLVCGVCLLQLPLVAAEASS